MRHPFRPTRDSAAAALARAILGAALFAAYLGGIASLAGLAFIGMGG